MKTITHLFIFDSYQRKQNQFLARIDMLEEFCIPYIVRKNQTEISFINEHAPEPHSMVYKFITVENERYNHKIRGLRADAVIIDEIAYLDEETRDYLKVITSET